ncbi:hypothetical protein B1C78_09635 [Thioalkalivibrio denitrificans]|uniref:Uncharacterized protein n=1 Tax=Thioalkalivibrio denitrificans TaxID=108003 RepID=A0A1V3NGI7_9GAMM|nr:hypothetical protein [Thioalkalivibrio denitrificans]OOG23988.1 hypothetical protein B1C78_09635 [Thioalkalivibrio denitrificans]
MAGRFPFAGKRGTRYGLAPRSTMAAFFGHHEMSEAVQEKYYKWWYDWARAFTEKDPDLSATMITRFDSYPMGQHARHSFHLNGKYWPSCMDELGSYIANVIFPKLDEDAMRTLDKEHANLLKELETEKEDHPREPTPDVGLFRHI